MGKKRIIRKAGGTMDTGLKSRSLARVTKRVITSGTLHTQKFFYRTKPVMLSRGPRPALSVFPVRRRERLLQLQK